MSFSLFIPSTAVVKNGVYCRLLRRHQRRPSQPRRPSRSALMRNGRTGGACSAECSASCPIKKRPCKASTWSNWTEAKWIRTFTSPSTILDIAQVSSTKLADLLNRELF